MEKPKGLAAIILASKKPKDESYEKEEGEESKGEMDEGLLSAADDMMSAMKKGNSEAFAEALKAFIEMC
jgi:hypothetical protein